MGIYTSKISTSLPDLRRKVAEQEAVFRIFPDASYHKHNGYSSKSVNKLYNKWEINDEYDTWLSIQAYYEVPFIYEDKQEIIKVYSQPKISTLAQVLNWNKSIYFPKFKIKIRGNELSKLLVKDCHVAMAKFLTKNSSLNYKVDDQYLHSKIKKLMVYC